MKHSRISFHRIYWEVIQYILMDYSLIGFYWNYLSNLSTLNETLDCEYLAVSDIVNPCNIIFVARVHEQSLIRRFQTKRSKYVEFIQDFFNVYMISKCQNILGIKVFSLRLSLSCDDSHLQGPRRARTSIVKSAWAISGPPLALASRSTEIPAYLSFFALASR